MPKVVVANRLERGGRVYKAGETVDVSPGEARDLVLLGDARKYEEPANKPEMKGAKND